MADRAPLRSVSAFSTLASPHLISGAPGITVAERRDLGLATIVARRGQGGALGEMVRAAYGVELVDGPKVSSAGDLSFVGTGPGTWLAMREGGGWAFARELGEKLGAAAAISDQSSGYGVLRLSGPKVRDVLAKGVPVDFDPVAFAPGDAAVTLAGHVGIVLWQVDGTPAYDVAVFRSMAGSFWHWLSEGAAEFGMAVA